jgi:hypothetical protein
MASSFKTGVAPGIQSFFEGIGEQVGTDFDFSMADAFRVTLETDGTRLNVKPETLSQGFSMRSVNIAAEEIDLPVSGPANLNGATGTATMVASTVTATVPDEPDGGAAVPVGSSVYATVTTPGGVPKKLAAVRATDSTITISSAGSGYGELLESAGVSGALVAGTKDLTLANAVGDRLAVVMTASGGTPGVLSVKRKSATEVTVESWLAATGIQVLDTSTVKVYNFGQAAHETSTVRWAVVRP